jgi:hypothetical protein
MSDPTQELTSEPQLKVISLMPKVLVVNQAGTATPEGEEDEILAPFFLDEEEVIEDLGNLVGKVHAEFSRACKGLKWEAELEIGLQLGVKFTAKLKISPKPADSAAPHG